MKISHHQTALGKLAMSLKQLLHRKQVHHRIIHFLSILQSLKVHCQNLYLAQCGWWWKHSYNPNNREYYNKVNLGHPFSVVS